MRKMIPLLAFPVLLALVSTACTLSLVPQPTDEPNIATMIAGTMAALGTQVTDTAAPTSISFPTLSPTELPAPSPYPTLLAPSAMPTLPAVQPTVAVPNATRISFLNGATAAVVTAPIQAGATQNYVLRALQGQPMIVNVGSLHNDVLLGLKTQGGTTIQAVSAGQTTWQGSLPQTEDYYLTLRGGASNENFTLNISIPSRIQFAQGADSAKVTGKTVAGYDVSYVLFAIKGQKMTVDLYPISGTTALSIWGFSDGQPYVNANMQQTTHFVFTLPNSQDYIIQVVPQAGSVASYQLVVKIQ